MDEFKEWEKQAVYHHEEAVKANVTMLFHAIWCGRYLIKIKKALAHGRFGIWLRENLKEKSDRTARVYMQLARQHKTIPEGDEYARTSMRDSLKGHTAGGRSGKKFAEGDLIRAQAFKEFLKTAFKDWKRKEIEYLKSSLGFDSELEDLVIDALKKTRLEIRRRMNTLTSEDWRQLHQLERTTLLRQRRRARNREEQAVRGRVEDYVISQIEAAL